MNGIEKITEKIIGDARLEAGEIIAHAEAEAQALLAETEKATAAEANALVENARAAAEIAKQRTGGASDLDRRKAVLATKQEMIDVAFSRALVKLGQLPADKYIEIISKIAAEAVSDGHEEVIMSAEDGGKNGAKMIEMINKLLKASGKTAGVTLSKTTRDISGGLILKNGDVETNCTFTALLNLSKDSLVTEVAAGLFTA